MILYSIIPDSIVYGDSSFNTATQMVELVHMGCRVEACPVSDHRYRIHRVISTNPTDFLNPQLQPGSIIDGKAL